MGMNDEASTTNVNFPQGMNPWGMFNNGKGMSGSALGIGIAGLVAGGLALLGARLGNGLGGVSCATVATQRDLDYERELTKKDAELGQVKAQLYTDQKITELRQELSAATTAQAVINTQQNGVIGILQSQAAAVQAMQMTILKPGVIASSEAVLKSLPSASSASTAADNG